jgi:hypothetical protein
VYLPTKSSRSVITRHFTLPRHVFNLTLMLWLIALAGDVELNPGPSNNIGYSGRDQLAMYYMNARSTSGAEKLNELNLHFADNREVDIICVSETWLSDNILTSELLDESQYLVYRKDRDMQGRHASAIRRGNGPAWGGVLVAVNSGLPSSQVDLPTKPACEVSWIKIEVTSSSNVFVGCVYLPPRPSVELIAELMIAQ